METRFISTVDFIDEILAQMYDLAEEQADRGEDLKTIINYYNSGVNYELLKEQRQRLGREKEDMYLGDHHLRRWKLYITGGLSINEYEGTEEAHRPAKRATQIFYGDVLNSQNA